MKSDYLSEHGQETMKRSLKENIASSACARAPSNSNHGRTTFALAVVMICSGVWSVGCNQSESALESNQQSLMGSYCAGVQAELCADFHSGNDMDPPWTLREQAAFGDFKVVPGGEDFVYRQGNTSTAKTRRIATTGANWADLTVEARVKVLSWGSSSSNRVGILARYQAGRAYVLNLRGDGRVYIHKKPDNTSSGDCMPANWPNAGSCGQTVNPPITTNAWYRLKFVLAGNKLTGWVNDVKAIEVEDMQNAHLDAGQIGVGSAGNATFEVDDVRVTASHASQAKFLIIAASALAEDPSVKAAIATYQQDLLAEGWDSELITVAPSSDSNAAALALKQAIYTRWKKGLLGFVIIGSDPAIPTAYWRHHVMDRDGRDPADLFYADMDTWNDIDGDGVYENFESKFEGGTWVPDETKPGNPDNPKFYPELFFGRIAAGPVATSAADEAAKVAAYLARVHDYRQNGTQLNAEQDNRALVFGEGHDYQNKDQARSISAGSPNVVGLFNRVITSPERYAAELVAGYRFVTLMTHSSYNAHSLTTVENDLETSTLFTLDWLNDIDSKVSYANLFACGGVKFTVPNWGATFLYKKRFTLNVTGSVGGWGILPDPVYYEQLSAGVPIGVALRDYALRTGAKIRGEDGWPKAALHGDPLVRYAKLVQNKPSIISSSTEIFRVPVGQTLSYTFETQDLGNDVASLSVSGLPPNAAFDGHTLTFSPGVAQENKTYTLQVTVIEPGYPGRYTEDFALEVPAAPSAGEIRNPGFEEGSLFPAFWNRDASEDYRFNHTWTLGSGRNGSKGIGISNTRPNDASWIQRVQGLIPGRAYRLVGWLKANAAVADAEFGAAANLCLFGTFAHVGASGTFDWTQYSLPFVAPTSGEVTVGCRLGFWGHEATGQIWCDDLQIVEEP